MISRDALVSFLATGAGLTVTVALFTAVALGIFARTFAVLRAALPTAGIGQPPGRRHGKKRPRALHLAKGGDPLIRRTITSTLVAGCVVLPLVFTIALQDVFALPKTALLRLLAIIVGLLLASSLLRGSRVARPGIPDLALATFASFSVAATVLSVDPALSLNGERLQYQGLLSILSCCALFLAARHSITTVIDVRQLAIGIVAAATVAAGYAIVQWAGADPIWSDLFKGRVFSTVGQANALASFLATALVLALALPVGLSRRGTLAVAIAVTTIGAGLLLTLSRGGYLALVAGLMVFVLAVWRGSSWTTARPFVRRVIVGSGGAFVLILATTLVWRPAADLAGQITSRIASIADPAEGSNRSHLDLWAVGTQIAFDHPIVGTGPDTFARVFPQYRDRVLPPDRAALMARFRPESPHNVYIGIAGGQGLPALASYLVLIVGCVTVGARAARAAVLGADRLALGTLVGAVVVHAVTDLFVTAEPSTTGVFWITLGALAGFGGRILSGDRAGPAQREAPARAGASRD